MRRYIISARGHELSGRVRAHAYCEQSEHSYEVNGNSVYIYIYIYTSKLYNVGRANASST